MGELVGLVVPQVLMGVGGRYLVTGGDSAFGDLVEGVVLVGAVDMGGAALGVADAGESSPVVIAIGRGNPVGGDDVGQPVGIIVCKAECGNAESRQVDGSEAIGVVVAVADGLVAGQRQARAIAVLVVGIFNHGRHGKHGRRYGRNAVHGVITEAEIRIRVGGGEQVSGFVIGKATPNAKSAFNNMHVGYTGEIQIPITALPSRMQANGPEKIDIGILLSNEGGLFTERRIYLFNRQATVVADIPTEAALNPDKWGTLIW